ncbi:MAG: YraN family protein [Lautropia sp.]|nr:YraN family protein [Lautropia sp.]
MNAPPVPPRATTRHRGAVAEHRALDHLQQAGLCLIAANVAYKVGEIDLVMRDGNIWVFIEVRSRRSSAFGGAAASVDARKQLRIRRAAQCMLVERFGQRSWPVCRFDVVAIENGRLEWIKNAF